MRIKIKMNNLTFNIKYSKLMLPDETMVKLTDVSKLHGLGWKHNIELKSDELI
jgi:hypothetical protein